MEVSKQFRFEAAHILPKHPGKCSRLHGHSWQLTVCVEGQIDRNTGFVQDYAEISAVVNPLIERLDHHFLGQWKDEGSITFYNTHDAVPGLDPQFYPSSENLLWWIAEQLESLNLWVREFPGGTLRALTGHWHPGQIIEVPNVDDWPKIRRLSGWSKLILNETCTSSAILTWDEYRNQGAMCAKENHEEKTRKEEGKEGVLNPHD